MPDQDSERLAIIMCCACTTKKHPPGAACYSKERGDNQRCPQTSCQTCSSVVKGSQIVICFLRVTTKNYGIFFFEDCVNCILAEKYWFALCRALWWRPVPVALRCPQLAEHGPMQCNHVTRHDDILFWHPVLIELTQLWRRHASITPLHVQMWLAAVAVRPPSTLLQFVR